MTAEKNYLKALRHGAASEELTRLEKEIVDENSTEHLIQLLRKTAAQLAAKRARLHELTLVNVRLATKLSRIAEETPSPHSFDAALEAAKLWGHTLNDATQAKRLHLRVLLLGGYYLPDRLTEAIEATNGPQATLNLLRETLKTDHEDGMKLSQVLLQVLQNQGSPKKILFEALKALRKWPDKAVFHQKVRAYAQLTQRAEEALLTTEDLLRKHPDDPILSGLLLESIGRLHQILQADEPAFEAYVQALKLNPSLAVAWQYGKLLSEKLSRDFFFERPTEITRTEGLIETLVQSGESPPTMKNENAGSLEATVPGFMASRSFESLQEKDILDLRSLPPESPPPLPQDSQETPPELPPPDQHDQFDHIFEAERQRLGMEAEPVSEARPISPADQLVTTVSEPNWQDIEEHTSFDEVTVQQPVSISETSTQVGFFRQPPGADVSSEDSLVESRLGNASLEVVLEDNSSEPAYRLLQAQSPPKLSAIWRLQLLQKVLEDKSEKHALFVLNSHFSALLEEGLAGSVQLVTAYFHRLSESERTSIHAMWVKTLELLNDDQELGEDLGQIVLTAARQKPVLADKVYGLAQNVGDHTLKENLLRAILPLWNDLEDVNKTYLELSQLIEVHPAAHFILCEEWASACPDSETAYRHYLLAAQNQGKKERVLMCLEHLLTLAEQPSSRAQLWRDIAEHYWLASPDYWKESANACTQAIGHEPNNIGHWVALILKCQPSLNCETEEEAQRLLQNPNPELLQVVRNFLDAILLDLGESQSSLPLAQRRIVALALSVSPQDPEKSGEVLAAVLQDHPEDLQLLETYAHLMATHGLVPHKQQMTALEEILIDQADALDTMKQMALWGDLGAVRWAAGDSPGALSAMQKLFGILQADKNSNSENLPYRFVETAFSVLNSPEHRDGHPELLIAALEMKAQRQTKKDSIASLKRALLLAAKHDAAKAKELFDNLPGEALDAASLQAGRKAYDNLDQLENFCNRLRDRLKQLDESSPIKNLLLEELVRLEGQLLRSPSAPPEKEASPALSPGVSRHEQAANLLIEAGDYPKAITSLRQSIAQDYTHASSWRKLFLCAQRSKNNWLMIQAGSSMCALNFASPELMALFQEAAESLPVFDPLSTNAVLQPLVEQSLVRNAAEPVVRELSRTTSWLFGKPANKLGGGLQGRRAANELHADWQRSIDLILHALGDDSVPIIYESHRQIPLGVTLAPTQGLSLVLNDAICKEPISPAAFFALARSLFWGQAPFRLLTLLKIDELRGVCTALRAHWLQEVPDKQARTALRMGQKIGKAYERHTTSPKDQERLRENLKLLGAENERREIQKLLQGVSRLSHRFALLMTGKVGPCVQGLSTLYGNPLAQEHRLIYQDLFGFGISEEAQRFQLKLGLKANPNFVSRLSDVALKL